MISPYIEKGRKLYAVFVKVRDKNGKQISRRRKGVSSERKAKEVEFQLRLELEGAADKVSTRTWENWHNQCLQMMRLTHKQGTIIGYEGALKRLLDSDWNGKLLSEFTKADVHDLLFDKLAHYSPNVRKNTFKKIQRIFEMAIEEGILSRNPAAGVKVSIPAPEQKVLNAKEADSLLGRAKETHHRFYPVWVFALMTGMRSGEMVALRWSDIDFETGLISVTKQWTSKDGLHETKANRNRVVPINPELEAYLKELKIAGAHKDKLFHWKTTPDRRREKAWITHDDYVLPRLIEWKNGEQAQVLKEFCRSIGITQVKFHDLRATFITNMLAQGVPLVTVMAIVGHRKMSTTDKYLRMAGVGIKGATKNLGYQIPKEVIGKVLQLQRN